MKEFFIVKYSKFNQIKSRLYLNLGLLYIKTGNSNSSYYIGLIESTKLETNDYEILLKIYKVTDRVDEGIRLAKIMENNKYLSNYYYIKGKIYISSDTILSKKYFDSAFALLPEINNATLQNFQYHAFIVDYFLKNKNLDSAMYHCKKSEQIASMINDEEVNHHYLKNYSNIYLLMGDTLKHLEYRNQSEKIKNNYLSSSVYHKLNEIDNNRKK